MKFDESCPLSFATSSACSDELPVLPYRRQHDNTTSAPGLEFASTPSLPYNIMSRTGSFSKSQGKNHPDFNSQWTQAILRHPEIQYDTLPANDYDEEQRKGVVFNSMFNTTLSHDEGIRATLSFQRPCRELDAVSQYEDCYLFSLGTGLDGRPGRGHGGLTSLLMDQITGSTAVRYKKDPSNDPPATATMTVDYKAPIDTPCVIFARSWVTELSGRKVWVKGIIQDRKGRLCASGKALFVHPRTKAAL